MGFMFLSIAYPQNGKVKLTDETKLTIKDILDIRLQILAAQMTCGSYTIVDMGELHFPVSIRFKEENKIVFEIDGEIKPGYSKAIQEEIITESFNFVDVGIKELIRSNYPQLDFDFSNNIIGYWYYKESEGHLPKAKWQSGKFSWITNK